jgi:hypothetical protein
VYAKDLRDGWPGNVCIKDSYLLGTIKRGKCHCEVDCDSALADTSLSAYYRYLMPYPAHILLESLLAQVLFLTVIFFVGSRHLCTAEVNNETYIKCYVKWINCDAFDLDEGLEDNKTATTGRGKPKELGKSIGFTGLGRELRN